MWILDSCYRHGAVELWDRSRPARMERIPYAPSFYLRLPDPHAHWEMIEAIGSRYPVEECRFRTVYGPAEGYRITGGRDVADAIERETRHAAQLYNVDIRLDQRYLAEQGLFPCGLPGEDRMDADPPLPLTTLGVRVLDNPYSGGCTSVSVSHEGKEERLSGSGPAVCADLLSLVGACDPDVILFPWADVWVPRIVKAARELGLEMTLSRTGRFRRLEARSYWSYGRTEFREGSLIPDGRVLIDTRGSFNYREGGLAGVVLASRLTGLSPNMAARFTAGTLISTYEQYEALRRGIAVPYRKSDAERVRGFAELQAADRGGMIFQPRAGLYERVAGIDFTSLYPSIIVQSRLSPETIGRDTGEDGFLPAVLAPLLALRIRTKQLKKADPRFAGIDSILKWMLVTCFGYTGYRNAKFGRIEVHEAITGRAREILLRSREVAEELGCEVIHGIVDCLWVRGCPGDLPAERIAEATGLPVELERYSWIVFLPMSDGFGAYNRYYGRFDGGGYKMRGIAARRGDTPPYIRIVQEEMLARMETAPDAAALATLEPEVVGLYRKAVDGLRGADPREMAVRRQVSRLSYSRRCPEASAVAACRAGGIAVSPGMEIGYVVRDARRWEVDLEWNATGFDAGYYRKLLDRAWDEIRFALEEARKAAE
jgi:DNA polymerase I